jgi:hypothetical protein
MRKAGRIGLWIAIGLVAAAVGAAAGEAPLTNTDVVAMINAGLGSGTIIAKIKASPTAFRLDTASLAILTQQGVPDRVIKAMIERQSPTRPEGEPQGWPREEATRIWSDLVRVVDRCRSRGEVMLFDAGVQFGPVQDSSACVDTVTAFSVVWDQIDTICFKYVLLDNATIGVFLIRTQSGKSYQIRASQFVMQAVEKEFRFRQPRLNYRCD